MSELTTDAARYAAVLSKLTDLTQAGSLEWSADALGRTPSSLDPAAGHIVWGESFSASWKGDDLILRTKKIDNDTPKLLLALSPSVILYVRESGQEGYQQFPPPSMTLKLASHLLDLYRAARRQHVEPTQGFIDRVLGS